MSSFWIREPKIAVYARPVKLQKEVETLISARLGTSQKVGPVAGDETTHICEQRKGIRARGGRGVLAEDVVQDDLHDSGEGEEDDGSEQLTEVGPNGPYLEGEALQKLQGWMVVGPTCK